MELSIKNIKSQDLRDIVKNYDADNDDKISDKECSELIFDFDKYVTDENREMLTDEFKKLVALLSGGNKPELIAKYMDRIDAEDEEISAKTWNSHMKLYGGSRIKSLISTDNAARSLEIYGVGTEQYNFQDFYGEKDNESVWNKIAKYSSIVGRIALSAFLLIKGGKAIAKHREAKAALKQIQEAANRQQAIYTNNRLKAYELAQKEGNVPMWNWHLGTYDTLQHKYYDEIRYCYNNPYKMRETCSKDIASVALKENEKMEVRKSRSGWIYRTPRSLENGDDFTTVQRISLNVYPEKELINKLDNFLVKSGINANYKVPSDNELWGVRHETVIVYLGEKLQPKQEQELIKLIAPHTRKPQSDTMIGEKLAEGIYKEHEPDEAEVAALFNRAVELDFDDCLIQYLKTSKAGLYNKYGKAQTSPAIVKSVEMLLNKLEKLKTS